MEIPIGILAGVILLNCLVSFLMFGFDKYRAIKGKFRIRERTLLLSGIPFGLVGMLLGMRAFRHKTQKRKFKRWIPAVAFANLLSLAALGWLAMQSVITLQLTLY
ncbi:DUF1294 domain-containing protein [Planctomycetota bacterium]|nr:DUF1294 domain-containing protein [Planctomycetota bacterium]